ncbi:MAG: hypothetical protein LBN95_06510 [Prevotellaceae bacterium]|jgi:hypothetical protein|nr:hypothetical protein [Prevotellaceae bacterium]
MQQIDVLLDAQPELAVEMVELDNRNRLAHKELQLYNDHKTFHYQHPILKEQKEYDTLLAELQVIRQNSPADLLNEIANVLQNIRRIQSNLKNKKYKTDDEKQNWESNLQRAELRKSILETIIKQ